MTLTSDSLDALWLADIQWSESLPVAHSDEGTRLDQILRRGIFSYISTRGFRATSHSYNLEQYHLNNTSLSLMSLMGTKISYLTTS